MIMASSDKGEVSMAMKGSLLEICADLMRILLTMNDKLESKPEKLALLAGIQAAVKVIAIEEDNKESKE